MMISTGMVRRIDNLGRIVIPKEIRTTQGVEPGEAFEILIDGEKIILRKYTPGCALCGSVVEQPISLHGKRLCPCCAKEAANALNGV